MKDPAGIPVSARCAQPAQKPEAEEARAYIHNPIAGKDMLTPEDALAAIGVLAAMLEADEEYRRALGARKAPETDHG